MIATKMLFASSVANVDAFTWFNATTTRFDVADYKAQKGSCGGCGMNMFADVEGWAAVSAAESMQTPYACTSANGNYACATGADQMAASGISAKCGQCFSVRSQGISPFGVKTPVVSFNATVVDTCAHQYNGDWCPGKVGSKNKYGFEYHLNVLGADAKKLKLGDNPIVHFHPIDCPAEILAVMQGSCCDKWGKGVGCSTICPKNKCSGPGPGPAPSPATCKPDCAGTRKCVTQDDGYWAQCIDCTSKVFQKECINWGAHLKDAAEGFCNAKCAKETIV